MATIAIQDVLVKNEEGVSLITLNLQEKRNALSPGVLGGLLQALRNAEEDEALHCVVITGAGSAFCSGGYVAGFKDKAESGARPPWTPAGKEPAYSPVLRSMSKPIIAAINGPAVGAGFQMTLMCDIRIASEEARFGAAWIGVAIDAPGGAVYFLPRSIGLSNAFYMLYTGEMIDAATALEWRLVTKVVPPDELLPYTVDLAKRIARQATIPIAMNRRTFYHALESSYETMVEWTHAQHMICYHTEDHLEASKAFLEKRAPVYKGR